MSHVLVLLTDPLGPTTGHCSCGSETAAYTFPEDVELDAMGECSHPEPSTVVTVRGTARDLVDVFREHGHDAAAEEIRRAWFGPATV